MNKDKAEPSSSASDASHSSEGAWVEIDCATGTGQFAIMTDVLPADAAPTPLIASPTVKRRTLDDMRRLSEEIKRRRGDGDI